MKRSKKKAVAVKNSPVVKGIEFDKMLDEISVFAGPSVIWAGMENKWEVAALAFFWFVLCRSWAASLRRRNSK